MILLTGNTHTERLQNGTIIESEVVSRLNAAGQVEVVERSRQGTVYGTWRDVQETVLRTIEDNAEYPAILG